MNRRTLLVLLAVGALVWTAAPPSSDAHSATLWAYVEGSVVYVEAFFTDGTKIKDTRVVVADAKGNELLEGKTDSEGKWNFVPPTKEPITVVLMGEEGHRADFALSAADLKDVKPATPPRMPPGPGPTGGPNPTPTPKPAGTGY